mgnify:CR=1 FL=1
MKDKLKNTINLFKIKERTSALRINNSDPRSTQISRRNREEIDRKKKYIIKDKLKNTINLFK